MDNKLPPNYGQSVFNLFGVANKTLSSALNNYQDVFGIPVDVYRIDSREINKLIKIYGPSQVSLKDPNNFKYLKTIRLLNAPTDLAPYLHSNADEMEVKIGTNELVVGDLLRIPWINNTTLDYFVDEVPRSISEVIFVYRLVSQFNIKTS